jgi:5-methylcytosine-specific restriction endonuclease McrA
MRSVPEWIAKHDDQKVPARVRQRVFGVHEGICHLTGRKIMPGEAWELEHVHSLILGGQHKQPGARLEGTTQGEDSHGDGR